MSLRIKASKALFWTFVGQFGVQIINFIVLLIITRLLSPKEIGLIAMIGILIGVGNILINSGISQSILRNPSSNETDYSALFYFNLIISLIVYFLVFFSAPFFAEFYQSKILILVIRIYCLTFILNSFSTVQIVRLSVIMDFRTQALIAIPCTILSGCTGIILAMRGYGVWSLVWSPIVFSITTAIAYWSISKWRPNFNIDFTVITPHWKFGRKLMYAGLIDAFLVNFNSSLIGKLHGIYNAGLFYRADSVKQFPLSNLALIINKISYPLIAQIQDDPQKLAYVFRKIFQLITFITFPILIFCSVEAEPIFRIMFTDKWIKSVIFFQLLCISGLLYPIHSLNLTILNIKGYSDKFLILQLIKTFNLLVIITVSLNWGIVGLIYGLIVESVISFFINTFYMNKLTEYGTMKQLRDIIPPLIISCLLGLITFLVDRQLQNQNFDDFKRIFVSGFICCSIYLFLCNLFFKEIVQDVKKIILDNNIQRNEN